jgi:hypothetical protein
MPAMCCASNGPWIVILCIDSVSVFCSSFCARLALELKYISFQELQICPNSKFKHILLTQYFGVSAFLRDYEELNLTIIHCFDKLYSKDLENAWFFVSSFP